MTNLENTLKSGGIIHIRRLDNGNRTYRLVSRLYENPDTQCIPKKGDSIIDFLVNSPFNSPSDSLESNIKILNNFILAENGRVIISYDDEHKFVMNLQTEDYKYFNKIYSSSIKDMLEKNDLIKDLPPSAAPA